METVNSQKPTPFLETVNYLSILITPSSSATSLLPRVHVANLVSVHPVSTKFPHSAALWTVAFFLHLHIWNERVWLSFRTSRNGWCVCVFCVAFGQLMCSGSSYIRSVSQKGVSLPKILPTSAKKVVPQSPSLKTTPVFLSCISVFLCSFFLLCPLPDQFVFCIPLRWGWSHYCVMPFFFVCLKESHFKSSSL